MNIGFTLRSTGDCTMDYIMAISRQNLGYKLAIGYESGKGWIPDLSRHSLVKHLIVDGEEAAKALARRSMWP